MNLISKSAAVSSKGRRRAIAAAALLASATSWPVQAQLFGGSKPPPKEPVVLNGTGPAPDVSKLFKAENGPVMSPKRLVLASFTVEFATEQAGGARSERGDVSATQIVEVYLKGYDKAQLQAATDAAYAAFVEAAAKAGFEVVSKDQLLANSQFTSSLSAGKPSGLERESGPIKSISFAPSGMAVSGIGLGPSVNDYTQGASSLGALGGLMAIASVASATGDALASMKPLEGIGKALGDAHVMQVRLGVYFADMKNEFGSRSSNLVSAGIATKLGLYLDPRNTQITVGTPDMSSWRYFRLTEALVVNGDPFTGSTDESPTGQNLSLGILNALANSGRRSHKTNRYALTVNSKTYGELAATAMERTAPLVFAALAADK